MTITITITAPDAMLARGVVLVLRLRVRRLTPRPWWRRVWRGRGRGT